ncbi:MAG: DUF6599 family protein, partial [Verrucomicrobiota bacterium]
MRQLCNPCSRLERTVGFVVLLSLLAIAGGVFLKQFSFNPAVLIAREIAPPEKHAESPAATVAWLPPALKEFGPAERFTPDTLYDKIDGKAELYLAAGVVGMRCQRFALKEAGDQWLEWFDYDMGTLPQAFSVFSTQRRAEGESLDLTDYAYRTQNAVYFVAGSNYVEVVASSPNPALMNATLDLAKRFVAASPLSTARLPEFEIFPPENLVPGSQTLESTDAFGFDQFKNVFTAQYHSQDTDVMVFVTSCSSAEAAAALSTAYRSFLLANGGKDLDTPASSLAKPVGIMGGVELVFSKGNFVAGVHSAPSIEVAVELAGRLNGRLAEKNK